MATTQNDLKAIDRFRVNVQQILDRRGMERKQLATLLGMSPQQLSNMLNGVYDPKVNDCERVATALGVSLARIFR